MLLAKLLAPFLRFTNFYTMETFYTKMGQSLNAENGTVKQSSFFNVKVCKKSAALMTI